MTYTAASSPFVPYGQGAPRGLSANEIGTHGAQMDQLSQLGLPAVPGVTVSMSHVHELVDSDVANTAIELLQGIALRRLDDKDRPILIRLSSSADRQISVLPPFFPVLGVTDSNLPLLFHILGQSSRLYHSWADSIRLTAVEILGVPADVMEDLQHEHREPEALVAAMRTACVDFGTGPYPVDPAEQVAQAAAATLSWWTSPRALRARRAQGVADDAGIAIHLEAIRIGPWTRSGRGKVTSRDQETGQSRPSGFFYPGLGSSLGSTNGEPIESMPGGMELLNQALLTLESHFREVVEIEFEVRDSRFAIISALPVTRPSARAALHLASDLAQAGTIDRALAVTSLHPDLVEDLLHTQVRLNGQEITFASGLPASPGAATGMVALSSEQAVQMAANGQMPILMVEATTPADVTALLISEAVVTSTGGLASHAAVVARGAGRPAVCGATKLRFDLDCVISGDLSLHPGDLVTIDGTNGKIYLGSVDIRPAEPSPELSQLLAWADDHRVLGVRANADTPRDVETALSFGAEGIGLCRTEHQFLGERLPLIRAFLLAEDQQAVDDALSNLFDAQCEDFTALFRAIGNRPVTVRLLDAPLHEFIPANGTYGNSQHAARAIELHEENPMLGLRGIRLAIKHDGLYYTQAKALFTAWIEVNCEGITPSLEIMIPLVSLATELAKGKQQVQSAWSHVAESTGVQIPYLFGCMIETPRAALLADELAELADFMSFGTNDLTQLAFGFSRDDIERSVLQSYAVQGVLPVSPFASLDEFGVGKLIEIAISRARSVRPDIKLGLCGEQGGDPASIHIIQKLGLDYVSCSPPRVPIARLATAHAALDQGLKIS